MRYIPDKQNLQLGDRGFEDASLIIFKKRVSSPRDLNPVASKFKIIDLYLKKTQHIQSLDHTSFLVANMRSWRISKRLTLTQLVEN